jgi:hypothetical protein
MAKIKSNKPKRTYTRKKKEEPPISVKGISSDGTLVMDGGMLPPNFRQLHIRVGDVDYVVSMETIKCKLRAIRDKYADKSVEEVLGDISTAIGEQVAEVTDYAKEKQIKEGIIGYVFEFLLSYFIEFSLSIIRRLRWISDSTIALVLKFFHWLGGFIPPILVG